MKPAAPSRDTVDAVRAWRRLGRAERRGAWRDANRLRVPGTARVDWNTLPPPTPLQAHILSGRAHPNSQNTLAVSLGLNRAQRRALKAKKGPRRMVEPVWGLPGAPGSVKSRPTSRWPGLWSKFAVRLEFNRRLLAHAKEYRRENTRFKRAARYLSKLPRRLWRGILNLLATARRWARGAVMRLSRRPDSGVNYSTQGHPFHLFNRSKTQ